LLLLQIAPGTREPFECCVCGALANSGTLGMTHGVAGITIWHDAWLCLLLLLLPLPQVAPLSAAHLWEFCALFCSYYLCNRLMMWQLHRACEGGDQEMWRGSQMWVWVAPNHCKAIWKVRATHWS
jgi:hypothetical protein